MALFGRDSALRAQTASSDAAPKPGDLQEVVVYGIRASLRESLETKRRGESESKNRLDGLRAEYASAIGKKGSLEAVIAEHGYSTESVRRLFQSGAFNGGVAPAGVLADFIDDHGCDLTGWQAKQL